MSRTTYILCTPLKQTSYEFIARMAGTLGWLTDVFVSFALFVSLSFPVLRGALHYPQVLLDGPPSNRLPFEMSFGAPGGGATNIKPTP